MDTILQFISSFNSETNVEKENIEKFASFLEQCANNYSLSKDVKQDDEIDEELIGQSVSMMIHPLNQFNVNQVSKKAFNYYQDRFNMLSNFEVFKKTPNGRKECLKEKLRKKINEKKMSKKQPEVSND